MQEAYHPPCSEYSFCCPNWVPPRGYPAQGYPTWGVPCLGVTCWGVTLPGGYPAQGGTLPGVVLCQGGTLPGGTLPGVPWSWYPLSGPARVPPWLDLAGYPLPVCPMELWVMLQSIMGWVPPLCGQTDVWMDG